MCSMGIIEEQCCHAGQLVSGTLGRRADDLSTLRCIAYTVVNLVKPLFSSARYSYADASSMSCPLFQDFHCQRCAL